MYGIDISMHQKGIDLSLGNYSFAILKATEGVNYTDPCFHSFVDQLTKLNKCIGVYHFARPDNQGTPEKMNKEAEHFIDVITGAKLLGNVPLFVDWETEPIENTHLLLTFIQRVRELTGIVPMVYSSKSNLLRINNSNVWQVTSAWVANWPTIKKMSVGEPIEYEWPVMPMSNLIWQYSSKGQYPGFKGNVDLDYTKLTVEEWRKLGMPSIVDDEELSSDMLWAVNMGLFQGYENGNFRPYANVTRNQLAIVLHRFYELLKK